MHRLAAAILEDLDTLAEEYENLLRVLSGYGELSEQDRLGRAMNALLLVAAGLEADDPELWVEMVKAISSARVAEGFDVDAVQQALDNLVEVLEPRVPNPEVASFMWRTVAQAQATLSQAVIERWRTAEDQFKYLADNIAVGIFVHQNGILRYAGREGARLLGYENPESLLGRSVFEFVHAEDRERVAEIAMRRIAGDPVPDRYEARLLKRDGQAIDVEMYSTLTEYEGEVATQGAFIDITDRKREQDRIRSSQQTMQSLIDSMPFGVMIVGRDKRILHANHSALALMGYESESLVQGLVCHETMCPAEAERCPILDMGQRLDRSERVLVTKDGDHVPILKSAVPLWLEGKEVLLEAFVDVTEQKVAREEVERLAGHIQQSMEHRGHQVQISTEIAQQIATTPALDDLYETVVMLVKERLGYYHVQLFLLNEEEKRLVVVAGYGRIGKQLVQQGHYLTLGKGVVGRAAAGRVPVLSTDVEDDPEWLYHPLLPRTRGELAVPIILSSVLRSEGDDPAVPGSRDRVLGVLDVQSDRAGALTDDDRILLEGLCGQIATAIESTRLRQETEEYLSELERLTRTLSGEGWDTFRRRAGSVGYLYDRKDVVPAEDYWTPEMAEAASREEFAAPSSLSQPMAVAPLKARGGALIGVLGVLDDPANPLTEDEVELLTAVSEQISQALESARLFEETQRRAREQTLLFDASRALAGATLQAEDIADIIARLFVEVMDVPTASVSLIEPGGDALWTLADVYAEGEEGVAVSWAGESILRQADYPATARVMQSLEPLVVQADDSQADPAMKAYMNEHGVSTLILLPMAVKGRAIGIIGLEVWDEDYRHDPDELSLAMTLANQAAIALENARLLDESQRRAEDQSILNELGQALAACQDVDSVLREAYLGVSRLIGTGDLTVMLYDEDHDLLTLELEVTDGEHARPRTSQSAASSGFMGHLIATRQPLLIREGVEERIAELGLESKSAIQGRAPASWLGVPMMIRDRIVGTMVLANQTTPRAYNVYSQELLTSVASQAAMALENVRLLEGTQAALAEVETTHRTYLRRAWQEHLRQRETLDRSSYLYDRLQADGRDGVATDPELRRPEIERAVAAGQPAVAGGDGGEERSGLAVPITLRGQTLGVIGVEAPAGKTEWSEDEIALVEAVGEQLGQALESARLFADTQRRAERERLIGEITAKIRSSTDLQAILETTAVELGQLMGTSRARVRLGAARPGPGRDDVQPGMEPEDTGRQAGNAGETEDGSQQGDGPG